MSENPRSNTENPEPETEVVLTVEDKAKSQKRKKKTAPKRDSKARTASAAVFFNDNKAIAGFGNAMRAVFTSIREVVENSLDASEKRGITPFIVLQMRKLNQKEVDTLMGTSVVKTKEKRVDFVELSCRDNGVGVPRVLVPQLFGTVLAGTKYGAQQTRGRFGLGSKMVLLHAMSTLDLPIQITTRPYGEDTTYRVQLFINLEKNEPIIHKEWEYKESDAEYFQDYGTEIKVSFTGNWNLAKNYVREYFKQLAIITPYADIHVTLPGDEAGIEDIVEYKRVVDELPKPPEVVKIHPWGTDISTFRREMTHSNHDNLVDFLVDTFMGVNQATAESFFKAIKVDPDKTVEELTSQEIRRIVHDGFTQALKESKVESRKRDRVFKFDEPKGDSLSPLGADRLRKGLEKELNPDFVESITRKPKAYEGHPFIIEAALGYGGGVNKASESKAATVIDNKVIYRYANRIPLIFGAGNDLITQTANSINWSDYGLTRGTEPLALAVSLVSTKIPFPETSKEYISNVDEIKTEVELVLRALGRKLKTYLGRKRRRQRERQRKSRFEKYAPDTVSNLLYILEQENLWDPVTGVKPERIISALASGKPRIGSNSIPNGMKLTEAPIWSTHEVVSKLQNNDIFELSTFLRTPNDKLTILLDWDLEEVDNVKRRTIRELEFRGEIPELDIDIIIDPEVEKRFHKKTVDRIVQIPRLGKALSRRWIRNIFDYLVSPFDKLALVQGLFMKLLEQEKYKILQEKEEIDDTDLIEDLSKLVTSLGGISNVEIAQDQDRKEKEEGEKYVSSDIIQIISTSEQLALEDVLPSVNEILELDEIKKLKIKSPDQFYFDLAHPSAIVDSELLSKGLVRIFKEKLLLLIGHNTEVANLKISTSQKWIDGTLRNSFNRRNINTVLDLMNVDDSVLLEIGGFKSILFSSLIDKLVQKGGSIDSSELKTIHPGEKVKLLKKAGIHNIPQFLSTPVSEMVEKKSFSKYLKLLVEESKDQLTEYLTQKNLLGELQLLKILSEDLENELQRLDLTNTIYFLKLPLDKFQDQFRERIKYAKKQIGRNFDGLKSKHKKVLKKLGVSVLEEVIFNPNHFLRKDLNDSDRETFEDLLENLMKPIYLMDPHLITNLIVLKDAGVTTVGKFLVWPLRNLSQILPYGEEWVRLIKENFRTNDLVQNEKKFNRDISEYSHLLGSDDLKIINEIGLSSIGQIIQLKWGDIFPDFGHWSGVIKYGTILTGKIKGIADGITNPKQKQLLHSLINDLNKSNLHVVLDLFRLSMTTIPKSIKGKKKRELLIELVQDFKSDTPKVLKSDSDIYKAIRVNKLIERLGSPLVYIDVLDQHEIDILDNSGVKTLAQLIIIEQGRLYDLVNLPDFNLGNRLQKATLKSVGTLIYAIENNKTRSTLTFEHDGIEYFNSDDIRSLINSGFSSVESLLYMSDPRIFEAQGIGWDVIDHYKKLVRSPLVLISWKSITKGIETVEVEGEENKLEEREIEVVNYETFNSLDLEKLNKSGISRVFDFITYDPKKLTDILGWDLEKVIQKQSSCILQEAGIKLDELDLFRQQHIEVLKDEGIITIEDLYFTTSEETWELSLIPWQSIQTIKDILHLDLVNAIEELGEEMVQLLKKNGIDTILDLYLTGDPILSQKTGEPEERFENLKNDLDIGELIKSFDKCILFTPNLTYFQTSKLMASGYPRIIDIVLGDNKKIAKILGLQKKEIDYIMDGINRDTVDRSELDRGVRLQNLKVFTRTEIRTISKSGIFEKNELDTLQEILYQIDGDYFHGEDYLLQRVLDLKQVSYIPLDKIGDLNETEVKLLEKYDLSSIADVLQVGFDDLPESNELYTSLTNVTRSVIDLRPFMAIAHLPAIAAMHKGESDENLLDAWIENDPQLHSVTMNSLRSLLSLPIAFTQFVKHYPADSTKLEDMTVGDIILEYHPDETSPEAILHAEFKKRGSLIRLLKEGSTPITLLDITAEEFRALNANGITTIERLLTKDPKYLISIAGNTQKFWREIRDYFTSEEFETRMTDVGIPFTLFRPNDSQQKVLDEYDFAYLDQMLNLDEIPKELEFFNQFFFASTTFLIGTAGEKELVENEGAGNIVEAIIAMRQSKASKALIHETLQIAWNAFTKYQIPFKNKKANNLGIYNLQDLFSYTLVNRSTKSWDTKLKPLLRSVLHLPLPSRELKVLVKEHRCVTFLDALTNPMVFSVMNTIRSLYLETGEIPLQDTSISLQILKKLDKSSWNRLHELPISLQDIIASPRTSNEVFGIKQRFITRARNALKTPLSRLYLGNRHLLSGLINPMRVMTIEDVIYAIPQLFNRDSEIFSRLKQLLESEDIQLVRGIPIPERIQSASTITFNTNINDYQSLFVNSVAYPNILKSISRGATVEVKKYIQNSLKSLMSINTIPPESRWNLWKLEIRTVSDFLLAPVDIRKQPEFTSKQVREIKEKVIHVLEKGNIPDDNIKQIAKGLGENMSTLTGLSLPNLISSFTHPLIVDIVKKVSKTLKDTLKNPVLSSEYGSHLKLNDAKQLLDKGVVTFADFLAYPEELDQIIPNLTNLETKLKAIKGKTGRNIKQVQLQKAILPDELKRLAPISGCELALKLHQHPFRRYQALLNLLIDYTDFNGEALSLLKSEGYRTYIDLLISSPAELARITKININEVIVKLESIDVSSIAKSLSKMPMQVASIEKLSRNTIEFFNKQFIQSLVELERPVSTQINRVDQKYINTLLSILDSSPHSLLMVDPFSRNDVQAIIQARMSSVREAIEKSSVVDDNLGNKLQNISEQDLIQSIEKHRRLSDLDGIVVADERILISNGIFSLEQLAITTKDSLKNMGLDEEKYTTIVLLLHGNLDTIVGIDDTSIKKAKQIGISTVAEFLSAPEMKDTKLPKPIKIKQDLLLSNHFHGPEYTILSKEGIAELKTFVKSKKVKSLIKSQSGLQKIVASLNLSIHRLPRMKHSWALALNDKGIYRIYQYLLADVQIIADTCNISYTSAENSIGKLELTDLLHEYSQEIITLDIDSQTFHSVGIVGLEELMSPVILKEFIAKEIFDRIEKYRIAYTTELWKAKQFWSLEEIIRVNIAKIGDTIADLHGSKLRYMQSQEYQSAMRNIIGGLVNEEFVSSINLANWIGDEKVLQQLKEQDLDSYHAYQFADYKTPLSLPWIKNFRSPLFRINSLSIKQILRGFKEGITAVNDIIPLEEKSLSNKLKLSKTKIGAIVDEIKDLPLDDEKLPDLSFFNEATHDQLRKTGIQYWPTLLGGIRSDELALITGFTDKTRQNFIERLDVPIWYITLFREQGLLWLKKITKTGLLTIADLLIIGKRIKEVLKTEFTEQLYKLINVSEINKGMRQADNILSQSAKIRVKDLEMYQKNGITSPITILIGSYSVPKSSPLIDGINDWLRIGGLDVDVLEFPEPVIKSFRKEKYNAIGDVIVATNEKLRKCGATNRQIAAFRKKLLRKKQSRMIKGKKPSKKTAKKTMKKKTASKKKTAKKTTKKKTASKKKTAKKTTKKKTAKKTTRKTSSRKTTKRRN